MIHWRYLAGAYTDFCTRKKGWILWVIYSQQRNPPWLAVTFMLGRGSQSRSCLLALGWQLLSPHDSMAFPWVSSKMCWVWGRINAESHSDSVSYAQSLKQPRRVWMWDYKNLGFSEKTLVSFLTLKFPAIKNLFLTLDMQLRHNYPHWFMGCDLVLGCWWAAGWSSITQMFYHHWPQLQDPANNRSPQSISQSSFMLTPRVRQSSGEVSWSWSSTGALSQPEEHLFGTSREACAGSGGSTGLGCPTSWSLNPTECRNSTKAFSRAPNRQWIMGWHFRRKYEILKISI